MLSGNTDAYQPAERAFGLTRQCLEVLSELRHPVGLITKNSLVVRDLDLLTALATDDLVHVCFSITTLDETVRRKLEPRTASIAQRFRAVETLSAAGIPVMVNIAPVIPGLTDHELIPIARRSAEAGARKIGYSLVRLNDQIGEIFTDWIGQAFPDRAERVLNRIRDTHGGKLEEKRFGKRHSGEGAIAQLIAQQYQVAKRRYFTGAEVWPAYNFGPFEERRRPPQLTLF